MATLISNGAVHVSDACALQEAIRRRVPHIVVGGEISGMPMITLSDGQRLSGGILRFGASGVRLTRNNVLEGVTIIVPEHERAVLNDTSVPDWGRFELRDVRTEGQVLLLAAGAVRAGHVVVDRLHIVAADVRGRELRPHGYGVDVLQGAFTLWNRQDEGEVTAELQRISAGSADHPVRGSGVFVGGNGDWEGTPRGGKVQVARLTTGEIHSDGGIPPNTPDLISGGVFVMYSGDVDEVLNEGPVTTYGPNDMVLDNWGSVGQWIAQAPITSRGPSGVGFVNVGDVDRLDVQAPIRTFGHGARGFNVYDGSLKHASFDSIITSGDGSVGVQVSRRLPRLEIAGDLVTEGGEGRSLVKGVQVQLKAIALSVKSGGKIGSVRIGGKVETSGDDVVSLEIDGEVDRLGVGGGIHAKGDRSDAVHVRGDGPDLSTIAITATHGHRIVQTSD